MAKMEPVLQLSEVGRAKVSRTFQIKALTKMGKELYLGRHEIEVGRDDITDIVIYEENMSEHDAEALRKEFDDKQKEKK